MVSRLGNGNFSGGHRKRKHHLKLASFSNHATHFDAAMMFFHDKAGEREPDTGNIALGGVERPENVGQVQRRDTTPLSRRSSCKWIAFSDMP
jgi:hypothetical protein